MIYVVVVLTALSVGLLVVGLANLSPEETRVVKKRLAAIQSGAVSHRDLQERRRRQARRERMEGLLEVLGERVAGKRAKSGNLRRWLVYGGYRSARAPAIFLALRIVLAAGVGLGAFFALALTGASAVQLYMFAALGGLLGWMLPFIYVDDRVKRRQRAISKALPDALDLLVVCMEAGLGMNQAMVRVADEIDRVSPELSDELTVVNLEIRAGTPREEALRNLGERTGVDDVRSLTSMLVQSDRFGTSIADSLRIHSETLRSKRMQKAEEQAAKTTVKMLFPLILFIFPAIFVVLLGPSVFLFRQFFGGM